MDIRGFHNGALRIWYNQKHYVFIACPISIYCEFKSDQLDLL